MISKAQLAFRTRHDSDSRAFETWYDNEDVQRLIWQIYQEVPENKKQLFAKPYVFYDNLEKDEATALDKLLEACFLLLREQNLKFLPFILKPRILPHFYAGFIHVNSDYIYIFDPVGTDLNNKKFRDCFKLSHSNQIGNLRVIVSAEQIQNTTYEKGLVSCGPICVEFLDYLMNHPEIVPESNPSESVISPLLIELKNNRFENYRDSMITLRNKHDRYLGQLSDQQLASTEFDGFYQEITSALLGLGTEEEEYASLVDQPSIPTINYSTKEIKQIVQQMYQNISPAIQQFFLEPHIFDNESLNLELELPERYQSLREKKLNYFPFLFKPKASPYFCAGLIINQPRSIYLFIPNGVIPAHKKWHTHLGLSSRFFIGDLPLIVSPQGQRHLPSNGTISIEFLDYIMNHKNAFEKPQQFIDLLKMHSHDYPSYIERLSQKQKKYLVPIQNSQTSVRSAQQTYSQYFSELAAAVQEVERIFGQPTTTKALKLALSEANIVLNELRRLPPTDDTQRLRLADLCSHLAHGLIFIQDHQVPHQADIFTYSGGSTGQVRKVNYDLAAHQQYMRYVSETALLLPGAGWHQLRNALFILAGALLIICGLFVAAASTPISVNFLLTLAGTAAISVGMGFFVGRNTGLASAVNGVKMQTTTEESFLVP